MNIIKQTNKCLISFLFLTIVSPAFAYHNSIHHELKITLDPSQSIANFYNVVTIPRNIIKSISSFRLNKNSQIKRVEFSEKKFSIENLGEGVLKFTLLSPLKEGLTSPLKLTFIYSLPLPNFNQTMETLFLSGANYFYPQPSMQINTNHSITFQIKILTPLNFKAISQGKKIKDVVKNGIRTTIWEEDKPQEEIFLIADRYYEFSKQHGTIALHAYLLDDDAALAEKYLKKAQFYIDFYSRLIAPYPYRKFALVENSKQTGFGMPSFTLLGSRVIRFPFILNTSYPHEILHNWFGNGVYISPDSGNWAEGLTTYLADHILLEQKEKDSYFRFQELMKYSNYINETNDFPLEKFKARDSMASQAIGYSKTLMVFHMLRLEVGDAIFLKSLRSFYNKNKFHHAGFKELQNSFESISKRDLKKFFTQWTKREGSPELKLFKASTTRKKNGQYLLNLKIKQTQLDPAFQLKIPIAVWLKKLEKPWVGTLDLVNKKQTFTLTFSNEPLKVLLDPYHEIFRRLNPGEAPPSIGQAYGAQIQTSILPESDNVTDLLSGYQQFAKTIKTTSRSSDIIPTNETLTAFTRNLWLFGENNTFSKKFKAQLKHYGVRIDKKGVSLKNKIFQWENHSFVFTLNLDDSKKNQATWVIASSRESIPGLIRKLPHYGKYGYLVFKGDTPKNVIKGTWPSNQNGLHFAFKKDNYYLPPKIPFINELGMFKN